MKIDGWKYYNHAAIPAVAPHENVDTSPVKSGSIWSLDGEPIIARWTSDFDCGYETNWWYVIKDDPLDIAVLKAKRRYEINKGKKNFDFRKINPCDYAEEIYDVLVAAFSAYPEKSRRTFDRERFISGVRGWTVDVFGTFSRESGELAGYALLMSVSDGFIDFFEMKTKPEYEKYSVNAAMVAGILEYHEKELSEGAVISDGARSISHETAFQDYLEKYFGFRKAYCRLHLEYNPKYKPLIKILYPFRKLLSVLDFIDLFHKLNGVMKMEEIVRTDSK
ncbi:MAG: hypothetical protein J6K12_00405 [Clostridia bacterium]|nr:hypothetical protein [Clostridia bacterium]